MDRSPPGLTGHGIFQEIILECVAISSQPRDQDSIETQTRVSRVSCIGRRFFHLLSHLGSRFYSQNNSLSGERQSPNGHGITTSIDFINHKIAFTLDIKANYKATVIKSMMLASGEKKKQRTKERKGEGGNYDKGDVSNPRGKEEAFFLQSI